MCENAADTDHYQVLQARLIISPVHQIKNWTHLLMQSAKQEYDIAIDGMSVLAI